MTKWTRFTLHVVLPTALGTCIYLGWRSTDLLVFRWLDVCGLTSVVYRPTTVLPHWALYSLPDGCWVYATTSWLLLVWHRLAPWTWLGVILAVGTEFGQLLGYVEGTYHSLDVVFYVGAFIMAGAINAKTRILKHRHFGDGLAGVR